MRSKPATIGLVIRDLHSIYNEHVWNTAIDVAFENNANLLIFCGQAPKSPFDYESGENVVYDLIGSENVDGLIIVSGSIGMILRNEEILEICNKFKPLPLVNITVPLEGIPGVLVDGKAGMKELVSHFIEVHNRRKIVFICGPEDHCEANDRFEGYMQALEEHDIPYDPELILQGNFTQISASRAVEKLLDKRKVQFDAIIGANDEMAIEAMRIIAQRGIKVPEEVSVGGFDDISRCSFITPSFTTVYQPIGQQVKEAVRMVLDIIDGKEVKDVVLPSKMIVRQSCGCFSNEKIDKNVFNNIRHRENGGAGDFISEFSENMHNAIEECANNLHMVDRETMDTAHRLADAFIKDILEGREQVGYLKQLSSLITKNSSNETRVIFYLNLLNKIKYFHEILNKAKSYIMESYTNEKDSLVMGDLILHKGQNVVVESLLKNFGESFYKTYDSSYLLGAIAENIPKTLDNAALADLLEKQMPRLKIGFGAITLYQNEESTVGPSQYSKLLLAYDKGSGLLVKNDNQVYLSKKLVPDGVFPSDRNFACAVLPLNNRESHYGLALMEIVDRNPFIYRTLQTHISGALELNSLFQKLEVANRKLMATSYCDELTGLYNRRGFLNIAKEYYVCAMENKEDFALFFADLNWLKKINDLYGHEEGDWAIRHSGVILQKTFGKKNVLARLGGDEFTVLVVNSKRNILDFIKERLNSNVESFNKLHSNKPYQISMSIGGVGSWENDWVSFEEMLCEADRRSYEDKKKRKAERES